MHDGADVRGLEDPERGVRKYSVQLDQLEAEPQVGLVGAVATHRVGVGHTRIGVGDLVADQPPQRGEDVLGKQNHVILPNKATADTNSRFIINPLPTPFQPQEALTLPRHRKQESRSRHPCRWKIAGSVRRDVLVQAEEVVGQHLLPAP